MNIDLDVSMGMQMVCPGKFVLKQNGRNDDEAEETGTPRVPDGEGSEVVGVKVRGLCAQPQLPSLLTKPEKFNLRIPIWHGSSERKRSRVADPNRKLCPTPLFHN